MPASPGRASPRRGGHEKFIDSIEAMNRSMAIPQVLEALREKDIAALAKAACWEADTNYPVPRTMSQAECEALLRAVLPKPATCRRAVAQEAGSGQGAGAQGDTDPARGGQGRSTAR